MSTLEKFKGAILLEDTELFEIKGGESNPEPDEDYDGD